MGDASAAIAAGEIPSSPVIARSTGVPIETVVRRMPAATKGEGFGVINVTDMREKLMLKGIPFERECRIFDVCQPELAAAILEDDMVRTQSHNARMIHV